MAATKVPPAQAETNVLGYAQITSGFATAATSFTQLTGLSTSVTIPTGGRRVKITVYVPYLTSTAATIPLVGIWDGSVPGGTQLSEMRAKPGDNQGLVAMAVVTPSAGAKTYNAGIMTTSGTLTANAAATAPAFILVEVI